MRPALVSVLAGVALLGAGLQARADWLVMADGTRVETRGGWEERGRTIVFTTSDGTLASVRASEVDLDASTTLTAEAARRAAAPADEKATERKSVLRITDADVGHVDTSNPDGAAEGSDEPFAGSTGAVTGVDGMSIASWDRDFDEVEDGVIVRGKLRNSADQPARSLSMFVVLRNDSGTMIGRSRAQITRPFLKVSEETDFEAHFPGIYDFATADFRIDATRPKAAADAEEEADGADEFDEGDDEEEG